MASPHHHHHHHHHSCCCSSSCSTPCCCSPPSSHHSPPPSQSQRPDPLLQTILTHVLQSPPPHSTNTQYLKSHHHHHQQTQSLLRSLLRVTALESSLSNLSPPSPSPPASLRGHAARIIQTHFRSFLARRSQSLRHLKHLSAIKSKLAKLKSSLSHKTLIKPESVSLIIIELLHELGSIQSRDSMILDAKRLIRGELIRFLEFVDGCAVKKNEISNKFVDNGRKSGGFVDANEPFVEKLSKRVEALGGFDRVFENDEQAHLELGGFHQVPDDEENLSAEGNYGNNGAFQGQIGYWNLLAPSPVKMESVDSDFVDKSKRVVRH